MENFAGVKDCDLYIREELRLANIPAVTVEENDTEVPYSVMGVAGNFEFTRAWRYWVVKGHVPIEVANELYSNSIGQKDVRVTGHCGCPPPHEWVTWILNEKHVIPTKEKEGFESFVRKGVFKPEILDTFIFSDEPEKIGAKGFIDSYHIDSQEGLNFFVETLRKYKVIPPYQYGLPQTLVVQEWLETERGWGQRPDGISIHTSMDAHEAFCEKYWKEQRRISPSVPDEYEREDGDPWYAEIDDQDVLACLQTTDSIRLYRHTDLYKQLMSRGIKKITIIRD